jgi:hypothetical protein
MIFDIPLPSPYLIPSPVISVVTMAVIEILAHTLIYGSLHCSTVPFSKTSNACIMAVIAEVLAYIFRMILGAFSKCFK